MEKRGQNRDQYLPSPRPLKLCPICARPHPLPLQHAGWCPRKRVCVEKRSGWSRGWREQNFPWCFRVTCQSQTPSPPLAPQQWAHDPSCPMRLSHPLSHSDGVKRGHVTSAGPIRNSRVTETLQRVFLVLWGWELRKESSGMPEVKSMAAGSRRSTAGLPFPEA